LSIAASISEMSAVPAVLSSAKSEPTPVVPPSEMVETVIV
jgi:hypothetical protein